MWDQLMHSHHTNLNACVTYVPQACHRHYGSQDADTNDQNDLHHATDALQDLKSLSLAQRSVNSTRIRQSLLGAIS